MAEPRYFLQLAAGPSGPHSLVALREMASANTFTPDTLIAPENSDTWFAIHDLPELSATLFPGPRKHSLKTKAFVATPDSDTAISVDEILRTNLRAEDSRPAPAAPPPITHYPNLRRRDYLLTAAICNGFLITLAWLLPRAPLLDLLLLSAFLLINFILYWIYYHVMSRY